MTHPPDITALLAETRWLGALARRLCGDAATAEDLLQDTLQRALQRPPRADTPVRGWLCAVLQRRRRDVHRTTVARRAREQAAARPEPQPSTFDVVARAELQRQLVDAVLALDEPHRTCVLLRFFENLPPRAIAARTATPIATVHSRLQRAVDGLRARFGNSREQWSAALLPLLPVPRGMASLTLGVSIMHGLGKVVVGVGAAVVACVWWAWSALDAPAADLSAAPPAAIAAVPAAAGAGARELAAAPERRRLEVAAPVAPPAPTADPVASLRGRVLDLQGRGLPGVALRWKGGRDAPPLGPSGDGGRFEAMPPAGADAVVADDPRWSTVLSGAAKILPQHECTVIVASRTQVAGRVVDAAGAPLAGAQVELDLPRDLGADLGIVLDFSLRRSWRTASDDRGEFALPDVPLVERAALHATLGGFEPRVEPLTADPGRLLLVLERPTQAQGLVRGVVVDLGGGVVPGARVSAGAEVARTDHRGEFTLDVGKGELRRLVALAPGFQPASFEPPVGLGGAVQWPAHVVLRLGARPLCLRGRVVDRQGKGQAAVRVWIADPLFVGVEDGDVLLAETALGRSDRPFWAFVLTDAAGNFEVQGLLDRAYSVRALEPRTLVAATRDGVQAGRGDVELVLDATLVARLRGRVLARDGTPLPGVDVKLERPALEVQVPGGTRDEWAHREPVRTDALGQFAFEQVPREGVEVLASGDTIMFVGRMLTAADDVDDFVVTADRRVHLQVQLAPPVDRADSLRVLDAKGQAMLLRIMRGDTAFTNRRAAIEAGRSHVLSLGEGAATLVLFQGEREVDRLPVQLGFGAINTVSY